MERAGGRANTGRANSGGVLTKTHFTTLFTLSPLIGMSWHISMHPMGLMVTGKEKAISTGTL